MMAEKKTFVSAIVLAGGRGSRMKSDVPKQYLELNGKPLLHYALEAFQRSPVNPAGLTRSGRWWPAERNGIILYMKG